MRAAEESLCQCLRQILLNGVLFPLGRRKLSSLDSESGRQKAFSHQSGFLPWSQQIFSNEGLGSEHFEICGPHDLWHSYYSLLLSQYESSHGYYLNEWAVFQGNFICKIRGGQGHIRPICCRLLSHVIVDDPEVSGSSHKCQLSLSLPATHETDKINDHWGFLGLIAQTGLPFPCYLEVSKRSSNPLVVYILKVGFLLHIDPLFEC